jgi:hypothetical protein
VLVRLQMRQSEPVQPHCAEGQLQDAAPPALSSSREDGKTHCPPCLQRNGHGVALSLPPVIGYPSTSISATAKRSDTVCSSRSITKFAWVQLNSWILWLIGLSLSSWAVMRKLVSHL